MKQKSLVIHPDDALKLIENMSHPPRTETIPITEALNRVIRVEFTENTGSTMHITQREPFPNVVNQGENLSAGEVVLESRILRTKDIGILASLGIERVAGAVSPYAGVITTGSELIDPGNPLKTGSIYNSNKFQLCAHLAETGCRSKFLGNAEDEPDSLRSLIERGMSECDVLLISGGVSMGDFDYVPSMLAECGAHIHFHMMSLKPGKPTLFAQRGETFVFGLPGNPFSTFVIFELSVKIFLYRWMGITYKPRNAAATLAEELQRKDASRVEYLPVRLEDGRATPLRYHGSSHLSVLGRTDGLIRIEQGTDHLKKGSTVSVRLI